jgi:NAD(P)-dependent dehydrogenase (short-subunit alcohol dehydrogenase family)
MATQNSDVWFITGCSTGFGRELAKMTIAHGFRTVATARDPQSIRDLAAGQEGRVLTLKLDVTNPSQAEDAVREAETKFGSIDVLVNNAGYGYLGAIEESDEKETRAMIETNFFGLARMTHLVLPGMRRRRHGAIVNISSIGGLVGFPGVAYYNASKFAVEGFSEALAKEVEPLGIKTLIVEPGPFRTDWAGRSIKTRGDEIADYAATAGEFSKRIQDNSGKQAGDPVRACEAIIQTLQSPNRPLRLALGRRALDAARSKVESLRQDLDTWQETTLNADYPETRATSAT